MISIKYLYVIIPVIVLLIGIIWSITHMSKKKGITNTNTLFIPSKVTNKQETKLETSKAKKKAKRAAKKKSNAAKKKAKAARKKSKAAKKKSKKSKRKHKTE